MKYSFSILFVFMLLVGCSPSLVCESPSSVIDGRCCVDANANRVCDSDEPAPNIVETKEYVPVEPVVEEPVVVATKEPVTNQVVKEPEPTVVERKAGTFKILKGEPQKYVEINALELHRYSTDKIKLDYLWYTIRNIGEKTLNPEVRILAEGIRRSNQEGDGTTSREFTYDLESLAPGEKQVVKLALDVRFGQINKSRDLTIEVYERYVAPKEVKGKDVYTFVPFDELEDTDIWWVDQEE